MANLYTRKIGGYPFNVQRHVIHNSVWFVSVYMSWLFYDIFERGVKPCVKKIANIKLKIFAKSCKESSWLFCADSLSFKCFQCHLIDFCVAKKRFPDSFLLIIFRN